MAGRELNFCCTGWIILIDYFFFLFWPTVLKAILLKISFVVIALTSRLQIQNSKHRNLIPEFLEGAPSV